MSLLIIGTGSYVGTGASLTVSVSQLIGIIPQLVITARDANAANTAAHCWKCSTMGAAQSIAGFQSLLTTGITALGSGSFTVGTSTSANNSGDTYYYVAMAEVENDGSAATSPAALEVGTYTGNGADDRNISYTSINTPSFLWVRDLTNNSEDNWRFAAGPAGDLSSVRPSDAFSTADFIQALNATSFQVGVSANTSGRTYVYVAFKTKVGVLATGTYDGNDTDGRDIVQSDVFQPQVVLVKADNAVGSPVIKTDFMPVGDSSLALEDFSQDIPSGVSGLDTDLIQAINADGFEVGSGNGDGVLTNDNAGAAPDVPYFWLTFRGENLPAAAGAGVAGDTGFGGFALPTTPYALFKTMLDVYKRYQNVRIQ